MNLTQQTTKMHYKYAPPWAVQIKNLFQIIGLIFCMLSLTNTRFQYSDNLFLKVIQHAI